MGQSEVINLLNKSPRMSTKEITEYLKEPNQFKVSAILTKLIKIGDIVAELPTERELKRIIDKYPKCIHGIWNIKVFRVKNE